MIRRLGKGAAIVILLFVLYLLYLAYSIMSFSNVNELRKTDAAIVLGAAVWGDEPSPVLKERLNHAISLYDKGYTRLIIVTGGIGEGDGLSEAEASRRYALLHGVRDEDILLESESSITEQNLANAYAIAKQKQLETFTIVSDPLHMKRALAMASDLGMDAYSSPTQTTVYKSLRTKLPFLAREMFFYMGYEAKELFAKG
ncbi:YdcF family protein [Paenibacillus sp. PL91]|uniref:YdcF family protein n=1 Tax=Paenibacillus sp. PL91 TaxID=2729538 RepID=UPI00145E4E9F|nr:YdcF family protein [Paenibacillus sp. PL91]MBC9201186.1 YdcF family protein [Paenibacillus sp. PL91]